VDMDRERRKFAEEQQREVKIRNSYPAPSSHSCSRPGPYPGAHPCSSFSVRNTMKTRMAVVNRHSAARSKRRPPCGDCGAALIKASPAVRLRRTLPIELILIVCKCSLLLIRIRPIKTCCINRPNFRLQ
jgi:hypothetical protein